MKKITLCLLGVCSMALAQEKTDMILPKANNDFALKLIKQLARDGKNVCVSPYSIQSALSMTALGAVGQTRAEMASALSHPENDPNAFHQTVGSYQLDLTNRIGNSEESQITLKFANRLFVDTNTQLLQTFTDSTTKYYGSSVKQMDFTNKPEQERKVINTWVSEQTQQRIHDLLPANSVNGASLVLVNATYFKADWKYPFKASATRKREFTQYDEKKVEVDFMSQEASFGYARNEKYQVVTMPYGTDKPMQFTLILPNESSTLKEIVSMLTEDEVTNFKNLSTRKIRLRLPKFEHKWGTEDIAPAMKSLGMKAAFSNADFSKISSSPMSLSSIYHQTFIKIDEKHGYPKL